MGIVLVLVVVVAEASGQVEVICNIPGQLAKQGKVLEVFFSGIGKVFVAQNTTAPGGLGPVIETLQVVVLRGASVFILIEGPGNPVNRLAAPGDGSTWLPRLICTRPSADRLIASS